MGLKLRRIISSVSFHTSIVIIGIIMIYPVLWMVSGSLKNNIEIFKSGLSLIPPNWRWDNFTTGWSGFAGITFNTFFVNSLIITCVATFGTVISSACIAYALARIRFKFRKVWFVIMISTLLLPSQVIMIPQYLIYNKLGWVGTFIPLILPHFFGMPFFIYLMMQFIGSMPKELDEAAIIDGCSKYTVFTRIILPILKPAIITTIVIQFYWKWDDYLGPLLYLGKPNSYPVSVAIKMFADASSVTDYGAMFAMSTVSLIPIFGIFLFFNRYLVEGISTSGLKG